MYYFPSVYKGGSSITYKDGVVEVACNAPIICFYKDGEFTDKIEENDKDYDEELKYIVKNELDTKKVTDKNGNVYSIDTIYPALYKNNEKKVSIPLWQFLTKTVGIALLITFVLIVAWIGLILVVDMLKKRV